MTATLLVFNLFCLVSFLISSGAHGVNIQTYLHTNFTGLDWESNSSAACNNFSWDKRYDVFSIRTDTCFIAYWHRDCKSFWSQKYMPGDTVLSSGESIGSFHLCNEKEGGSQLNLDITEHYNKANVAPHVLHSYKNVCSCVNVPPYVQNMDKWSINNHHNALLAYYESDCSENKWNSKFIPAGQNLYSRDVQDFTKTDSVTNVTFKYQSFGPDRNSRYYQTNCNSSLVTTAGSSKTMFESTTESEMGLVADFIELLEVVTNQMVKLQTEVDQSKENQSNFQNDMRKEQAAFFTILTQKFTEQKQELQNFTEKMKSDLRKLFS